MPRRSITRATAAPRSVTPLASLTATSLPTLPGLTLTSTLCGLAALATYAATLNPTVSHGDSGEMIAVAHTLGVAHPPGYPLYTLLAKLFSLVPLGSVAARVNFFSAVCDALAALFVCRAAALLTRNVWAGVAAVGFFAFSPLVWPYAVTAEVFALNNLFAATLLYLSVLAGTAVSAERRWRLWLVIAFVLGLGLANHHILVLMAAPTLLMQLVLTCRANLTRSRLAMLALAACLGLTPYLYLFIAPHFGSEIAWGHTSALRGFLDHLLRREYGTLQLAQTTSASTGGAGERLAAFVARLWTTTAGSAPLLLLAALPALFRRSAMRLTVCLWTIGVVAYLAVFAALSNLSMGDPVHAAVQERFWQQALVVLSVLAGLGLARVADLLPQGRRLLAAALAVAAALGMAAAHLREMDQRGHAFFREYGRALLDSLPHDAVLLITSDEAIGSVRYLQQVEGYRRDVTVLPTGQVSNPWFRELAARRFPKLALPPPDANGRFTCRQFLDRNLPLTRIFIVNKIPWLATVVEAYAPTPVGLADEVLPKKTQPPFERWVDDGVASFAHFDPAALRAEHDGVWERYVEQNYWRQFERFALAVSISAATSGGDPLVAERVVRALKPVADSDPRPNVTVLRNIGVAYQFMVTRDPGAKSQMLRYWRLYLAAAPANDADRETIARAVRAAETAPPSPARP
jgi:hypothetical protein